MTAANSTPFQFDYVIVTLPLGVLKKSTKLFTPSLPGDKLQAIKDSGKKGRERHMRPVFRVRFSPKGLTGVCRSVVE